MKTTPSPFESRHHAQAAVLRHTPSWQQLAVCSAFGLVLMALAVPASHAAAAAEEHDAAPASAAHKTVAKKPARKKTPAKKTARKAAAKKAPSKKAAP